MIFGAEVEPHVQTIKPPAFNTHYQFPYVRFNRIGHGIMLCIC